MAAHGGTRQGAGRPAKSEKYEAKIAQAEKRIADKLPQIVDAMIELALGVTVQEVGKEGEVNVYTKEPHFKAQEYLLNRIMGRPAEKKEEDSSLTERPKILGYTILMSQPPAEDADAGEVAAERG